MYNVYITYIWKNVFTHYTLNTQIKTILDRKGNIIFLYCKIFFNI